MKQAKLSRKRTPNIGAKNTGAVYLALLAILLVCAFLFMMSSPLHVDEKPHYAQILSFIGQNYDVNPDLTTIPGFHMVLASLAWISGLGSVPEIRLLAFIFSLLSVWIFFRLAKAQGSRNPVWLTYQYAFFPLLFPFLFLIYTDAMSLLCVLLALLLLMRRSFILSGLLATISIIIRQNNIIWLVFFLFLILLDGEILDRQPVGKNTDKNIGKTTGKQKIEICLRSGLRFLKKTWTFFLGGSLFLIFIVVNKGVSLGDKDMHPSFSFHTGNIFFFLFLAFFLLLPIHIANAKEIRRNLRCGNTWIWLSLLAVFFFLTFSNTHPYNTQWGDYFIRNGLLIFFTSSLPLKLLFFLPVAVAALSFYSTGLRKKSYLYLYPATFLYLAPSWLIEQRYFIIPLVLFLLFKKEHKPFVEILTLILFISLSLFFLYGIQKDIFFL